jgi:hypothetical protein
MVRFPAEVKYYLFSKVPRSPLGLTQPPIQSVLEALSLGIRWPENEAGNQLHLNAEIRMSAAMPTCPIHLHRVTKG